jgi:preprotein translocase subunit SecY
MTLLRDVIVELVGMFVADARLSGAILALVAVAAILVRVAGAEPLIGGVVLFGGSLLILIEAAVREARRRRP